MGSENEPAKLLLPYLQRADELQKHEPLVAYYCRLYAMERGLKIPQNERTKTTNSLLVSLMKQLEKDKKSIKLTPEDNLHVEGFALNVFGKADKQDRAGRADLNTAKTFYAASIFFEILNQFGALQPDLEEKQKYAAWKAADIRKALKEGRKPTAGPPAGDEDLSVPSDTASNRHDLETTETSVTSAGPESDLTHNYNDAVNFQHSPSIPPAPKFHGTVDNQHSTNIAPSMQFQDGVNNSQQSSNISRSSSAYSSASYPSQDYYPPPPASSESPYSQTYHQQYSQEHSPHLATNNYLSHETPSSFSYPHFQSYPSFSESSLPSVPVNYTHYQGSDASYPSQSAPLTTNYTSSAEQNSRSRNEAVSEPHSASQTYQYDSNYQPSPEKIAEAHKSARFAVGALAFDDVSVAVDYLRKSLELLTNPSAGQ